MRRIIFILGEVKIPLKVGGGFRPEPVVPEAAPDVPHALPELLEEGLGGGPRHGAPAPEVQTKVIRRFEIMEKAPTREM